MADITVLTLVGSLRAESVNRQLAELAAQSAPEGVLVTVYRGLGAGLGDLPLYSEDADASQAAEGTDVQPPAAVTELRAAVATADAVLVVSPEYNGSIPGAVKNAIDWLSRPYGGSAIKDKPLAVVGAALGRYGGAWAHDEARKSFAIAGARVVESIKLSLPLKSLEGKHPRENADVVANLRGIVGGLAAEVG